TALDRHPLLPPARGIRVARSFITSGGEIDDGACSKRDARDTNKSWARRKSWARSMAADSTRRDSSPGTHNTDTPLALRFRCQPRHQLEMMPMQTQIQRQLPR